MSIFAQRLKELREAGNLSIRELAKKIDVSDVTVGYWESAKFDIKGENLKCLAKFFGVSAGYLLGLED